MQGKIKILESDNQSVVKDKRVFEDANIHFAGLNTHRVSVKTKTKETDYIFMIDDTIVEADSFSFEGEIHQAGHKAKAYVWIRFYPVLLKKF
tara:strand:+ start:532 stop:807 length:276 start_codon:yes stop_codon:yes gene_type:complete